MQSTPLDQGTTTTTVSPCRDLLVLWQNPVTRAVLVIGRLTYDSRTYRFTYTRSAALAFEDGFRGLPGLRDRHRVHESPELFSVFAQRTLDPNRRDYDGYLHQLGLDRDATPLEQIVNSGGRRAADTIQLLEVPTRAAGRVVSTFLAHGVRYIPKRPLAFDDGLHRVTGADHEGALRRLSVGDVLEHRHESRNPEDDAATVLTDGRGTPVGYVPRALSHGVRQLIDSGRPVRFTVRQVNGPDAPPHLRLVVDLDAECGDTDPFATAEWAPLGNE